MTPVTLVAVFCSVMAAVAVVQLAIDDESDRVDTGTLLLVVGITAFALVWATVGGSWFPTILIILLSAGGLLAVVSGLWLITHSR